METSIKHYVLTLEVVKWTLLVVYWSDAHSFLHLGMRNCVLAWPVLFLLEVLNLLNLVGIYRFRLKYLKHCPFQKNLILTDVTVVVHLGVVSHSQMLSAAFSSDIELVS